MSPSGRSRFGTCIHVQYVPGCISVLYMYTDARAPMHVSMYVRVCVCTYVRERKRKSGEGGGNLACIKNHVHVHTQMDTHANTGTSS